MWEPGDITKGHASSSVPATGESTPSSSPQIPVAQQIFQNIDGAEGPKEGKKRKNPEQARKSQIPVAQLFFRNKDEAEGLPKEGKKRKNLEQEGEQFPHLLKVERVESTDLEETMEIVKTISVGVEGPLIDLTFSQVVNLVRSADAFRIMLSDSIEDTQKQIVLDELPEGLNPEDIVTLINLASNDLPLLPEASFEKWKAEAGKYNKDDAFKKFYSLHKAAEYLGAPRYLQETKTSCLKICASKTTNRETKERGETLECLKICMEMLPHTQKDFNLIYKLALKWEYLLRFFHDDPGFTSETVKFVFNFLIENSKRNPQENYLLLVNPHKERSTYEKQLILISRLYPNLSTMTFQEEIEEGDVQLGEILSIILHLKVNLFSQLKKICFVRCTHHFDIKNFPVVFPSLEELWSTSFDEDADLDPKDFESMKHLKRIVHADVSDYGEISVDKIYERIDTAQQFDKVRYEGPQPSWILTIEGIFYL